MSDEIEYKSKYNKGGFKALSMVFKENELKAVKTELTLNIKFENFYSGLNQFIHSKEAKFRGVFKEYDYKLEDISYEQVEKGTYRIYGLIKELQNSETENIPFIEVFRIRENWIILNLIYWYTKINNPKYDEFSNFLRSAIYGLWPESKRQLSEYWEKAELYCDEFVHQYSINLTAEQFISWCNNEFAEGMKAKYTTTYSYYANLPENTIVANIIPFSFPPDYNNQQWDFVLFSRDEVKQEIEYDVNFLEFRGEYNPILRIKVLGLSNENENGKCSLILLKNSKFSYHNRLISIFCDVIEDEHNISESEKRKIIRRGKTYETEELIQLILRIWQENPKLKSDNKATLKIINRTQGFQNVTKKQLENVKYKYLRNV